MAGDRKGFLKWLGKRESGRDDPQSYGVVNQLAFLGKYQQGEGMLHDLGYYNDVAYYPGGGKTANTWTGKWLGKNGIVNKEQYLKNFNNVQEIAIVEELRLNWTRICDGVPEKIRKKDTQSALLAGAHLCGAFAVIDFLKTGKGGQDENGTEMKTYMEEGRRFGNILD